jgi:UDP-glucose 4-epimerase
VVAAFVEQAAGGGALTIHGDGTQTRDFVHVRDITDALFRLGREETPDGTWNVASGRRTSIVELADTVEALAGTSLERTWKPRRLGDITASSVSAARLRSIGWRPVATLRAGIAELLGGES